MGSLLQHDDDALSTVYGTDTDGAGTETESVASSYASAQNRKKKDKKKAAAVARKAAAAAAPPPMPNNGGSTASDVVVEYVSYQEALADEAFAAIFSRNSPRRSSC